MEKLERLIPTVGERILRYELIEEIGRGGFGIVYRARQADLEADVALKLLIPEFENESQKAEMLARFEQEAKLSKELDHPAAIRVRDYGRTADGWPFIVSEFVRGRDLTELIYREGLTDARVVRIMSQVLGCLAEAHHIGIIHRDLKPANIKVRDVYGERDVVKVLDFGIAKAPVQLAGVKTRTGQALGTPYYMSPEQCRGFRNLDGRSDLYALGLIMAECIGQRRVVDGADTLAVIYAHARPDPHTFLPEVEASPLFPIIHRATQKERSWRYADAIEMRRDLLAAGGISASGDYPSLPVPQPTPTGPRLPTPSPRTPMMPGLEGPPASAQPSPFADGRTDEAPPFRPSADDAQRQGSSWRARALMLLAALVVVGGVALYLQTVGSRELDSPPPPGEPIATADASETGATQESGETNDAGQEEQAELGDLTALTTETASTQRGPTGPVADDQSSAGSTDPDQAAPAEPASSASPADDEAPTADDEGEARLESHDDLRTDEGEPSQSRERDSDPEGADESASVTADEAGDDPPANESETSRSREQDRDEEEADESASARSDETSEDSRSHASDAEESRGQDDDREDVDDRVVAATDDPDWQEAPTDVDSLLAEARRAGVAGDHAAALRLLEQVEEQAPDLTVVHLMKYSNYRALGFATMAADSLRFYLRLEPDDPNAARYRAELTSLGDDAPRVDEEEDDEEEVPPALPELVPLDFD